MNKVETRPKAGNFLDREKSNITPLLREDAKITYQTKSRRRFSSSREHPRFRCSFLSGLHFTAARTASPEPNRCFSLSLFPQDLTDEVCPQFDEGVVNVTQSLGREAHLSCIVHNLGRFKVAWMRMSTWSILAVQQCIISPNQRISVRVEGKTSTLIIKEVGTDDTGSYMCQINTVPMFSHIFYLDVVVPPTIIEEASSSDMSVREGTDVVLRCAASGLPEPSLTWRREAYRIMEIVNWRNDNASRSECLFPASISQRGRCNVKTDIEMMPLVYVYS
ncbi:neurotrimin [Caerostris darwini]|uniref:Neurotrimin n=1 Tax=Caerostris darwini TaxID=1538125 RepID=A0AAV4WN14_9ARAC|nr:neurotrimin [Caerostris darwini]